MSNKEKARAFRASGRGQGGEDFRRRGQINARHLANSRRAAPPAVSSSGDS